MIGFREESDARRCLADLKERFAKFGLELHPEKTRLIEFGRYAEERRAKRDAGPPETFDFLGFTHISGKTRRGDFTIHRKTSRKKFQAKLADLKAKLSRKRHADLETVGDLAAERVAWLVPILCGGRQLPASAAIPRCDPEAVAPHAATTQPTRAPPDLGEVLQAEQALAADAEDSPPLSQRAVCRSTSKVGAVCGSAARTDLCGGRAATPVPTAILF